jgi:hypothetical protein
MVTRFALSVFAALVWIAPVSADEIKAATIPYEHVKKGDDGLWSATDVIEIPNERSEHPKISDPKQIAIQRGAALRNLAVRAPA